ncbi:MAG: DUF5723 family protein, partial [Bacteroidales bacterium]
MNFASFAQLSDNYFNYANCKAVAGIDMSYEFSSNSITTKFLNTYLFGSNIDSLNKQRMFAHLKPNNTFGCDLQGGLSYVVYPDTFMGNTNMGLFVKYNKYYHVDMSFTKDLFKLFFDGNEQFAGQTVDLSNSSLNVINYEQIQFGILEKFETEKLKHTFGIGISLNNGYANNIINIRKGSLYTAPNAEYINFSANYDVFRSDNLNNSSAFKGIGTSINIYYSFETANKNTLSLELTNLGFLTWSRHSQQLSKDTSIHFEGVNVNDILNIQGNIFHNANADSILHAYTYAKKNSPYTTMTPACFKISYLYKFLDKLRTQFIIQKYFFSNYDPLFMIKFQYLPTRKNIVSFNFNYGGYQSTDIMENHNINMGIEFAHDFGKGLIMLAGTNYLNGYISPYSQTA